MIDNLHLALLQQLATEWRETPQQLLERLIDKENFDRHGSYEALKGKFYAHTCMSMDCFMKGNPDGKQR